jgi:hypothetical protein
VCQAEDNATVQYLLVLTPGAAQLDEGARTIGICFPRNASILNAAPPACDRQRTTTCCSLGRRGQHGAWLVALLRRRGYVVFARFKSLSI